MPTEPRDPDEPHETEPFDDVIGAVRGGGGRAQRCGPAFTEIMAEYAGTIDDPPGYLDQLRDEWDVPGERRQIDRAERARHQQPAALVGRAHGAGAAS